MHTYRFARLTTWAAGLTMVAATAFAQAQSDTKPFEPQVGQQGKDVVWVPTPQALVDKMLDMAKLTPQDYLMDLGSGDGRTVITAAKRGATAVGIEYNPDMVELSKKNAATENVGPKATFMKADLFETDLSKATVITMFLLPQINLKLRPTILDLKPGTRVVSNTFTMDDWTPDETATITDDNCSSWCTALLWIVPAKADGTWRLGNGGIDAAAAVPDVDRHAARRRKIRDHYRWKVEWRSDRLQRRRRAIHRKGQWQLDARHDGIGRQLDGDALRLSGGWGLGAGGCQRTGRAARSHPRSPSPSPQSPAPVPSPEPPAPAPAQLLLII